MKQPSVDGILIKKQFGQHFLKDENILEKIVDGVELSATSNIFEIGGGSGALTKTILKKNIAHLWVFEIDHDWATYLKNSITDKRLTVYEQNILDIDFKIFEPLGPWTILSNLPYNVTFPILHLLVEHRDVLKEGIIMIQEEVAQKLLKTEGRDYGFVSLYFQYYFNLKLLDKISPAAFYPEPKVYSRLVYLKPKKILEPIKNSDEFWKFIKLCFKQPRRTLGNNLKSTHYKLESLDPKVLQLRAQQLSFTDFIAIWKNLYNH